MPLPKGICPRSVKSEWSRHCSQCSDLRLLSREWDSSHPAEAQGSAGREGRWSQEWWENS